MKVVVAADAEREVYHAPGEAGSDVPTPACGTENSEWEFVDVEDVEEYEPCDRPWCVVLLDHDHH